MLCFCGTDLSTKPKKGHTISVSGKIVKLHCKVDYCPYNNSDLKKVMEPVAAYYSS